MQNLIKITQRGWPGHFICSYKCLFHRNTLIEYKDKKWIVSTVGRYYNKNPLEIIEIGYQRWYETMVFEAVLQEGYIDADYSKQIYIKQKSSICGKSWLEIINKYPQIDNTANEMHENIINEMVERIQE